MIYTIEIPDEQLQELALAVATRRGWTETATNEEGEQVANPVTANAVLTDATRKFWQDELTAHRYAQAQQEVEVPELQLIVT